ncbi:cold-shock protein [Zhongshania sp.]|jgi:CspA family cold shock protein|uniref:cold-shock protein n=1 Tax=Zhongshania sp. TaxID=1971902 RepID=UPI0039E68D67
MSDRVSGTVKWFNNAKGFGFISHSEDNDVFVHFRSIRGEGYRTLDEGQAVEFNLINGPKGLQAEDVTKV